jgi:hypothetical protein
MRAQIVATGVFFAAVSAYPVFGQALAEGALVHANAAAATAKAGTALGNALNKATTQIGQQMQTVTQTHVAGGTPQRVPHITPASSGSGAQPGTSSGGPMITSISGGRQNCAPTPTPAPGGDAAKATSPQKQDCAAPAAAQNQYKSVVHLSFPQ